MVKYIENVKERRRPLAINPERDPFTFQFEVQKIIYTNAKTKYMILLAKIKKLPEDLNIPREIVVQGTIPVAYKKDLFEGEGKIETHNIYGRYIKLTHSPKTILPQVESSLVDFIRKRVKGVGIKKAEKIVKTLGLDAITKIENDHQYLCQCGFKEKDALRIQEELTYHKKFEQLIHFLQSIHIEVDMAIDIYKELKHASVVKLRSNPYVISNIGKLTWIDADRIAKSLKFHSNFKPRYRSAILYYLKYQLENMGNICVKKEDLLRDFESGVFLKQHGSFPNDPYIEREIIQSLLDELISERAIIEAINEKEELYLYLPNYYHIEESIIRGLDHLMNSYIQPFCDPVEITHFLSEYEKNYIPLATKQKDAVHMALKHRLSILTGGPGTGKTATTKAIVKAIQSMNKKARITLLAPTGKASKRLSEMTGMKAMTIHRGLGLKGFGRDDEVMVLDDDFVIVDESSMIDAYLFNLLINHIGENTRLLLVGDYHQLPSVGPGLILRDLINSGKIAVTELTQIFRQAASSQLVTNAHKMNQGLTTVDVGGLTFDVNKGDSYFIERSEPFQIQDDIIETMKRFIKKGYKLDDFLVLTPMHNGILGTIELNRRIQREFNPPNQFVEIEKHDGTIFRVGDRVIQNENNYELSVFNGEIGTVVDMFYRRDNGQDEIFVSVEFPDKDEVVEYSLKHIEELDLAYSITIHKSQGSEAPIVIMPIHQTQEIMLDRVLIYTGYTRTKEVHIFFGKEELLNKSLKKINTDNRQSLIKEKIQKTL